MRVLIIGDAIKDVYTDCIFKKNCPDAPTVGAYTLNSDESRPGGAANVALNLAALSGLDSSIDLICALDVAQARSIKSISMSRVSIERCLLVDEMITKERLMLDGEFTARIDRRSMVEHTVARDILCLLKLYLHDHTPDLVILSEYAGGTVDSKVLELLLTMRDRLIVDTKRTDLSQFEGSLLLKLNESELNNVLLHDAIPERFFKAMIVTRGAAGSRVIKRLMTSNNAATTHTVHIPSRKTDVIDVCGCGDTYVAGLVTSLLKDGDIINAAEFATAAAAVAVSRRRTAIVTLEDVLKMQRKT